MAEGANDSTDVEGRDQTTHDFVTGLKEREELKAKLHEKEREVNVLKGQVYDMMKKIEALEKGEVKKRRPSSVRGRRRRPVARAAKQPPKEATSNGTTHLAPANKEMDPEKMYEEIAEKYRDLPLSTVLMAEKQFVEADTNGDGTIDAKELEHMLDAAAKLRSDSPMFTKSQVQDILKVFDLDNTNSIDFMECLAMLDLLRQNRNTGLPQELKQQYSNNNKSSVCSIQ